MKSPAHSVLENAGSQIKVEQDVKALVEQAETIAGNIVGAVEAIRNNDVFSIEDYATSEGQTLGITVAHKLKNGRGRIANIDYLEISGTLSQEDSQSSSFPMYRVARQVPTTDSGYLRPHYEISVADTESATGFTPLALVEQSVLDRFDGSGKLVTGSGKIGYDIFNVHDELSNTDLQALKETGLYVHPQAQSMLEEVHHIIDLAANQGAEAALAA